MSTDDVDLEALAVVEPTEFVAARNARAKELRAAGERDRAAAVAKLRKPSWTAWALNVLAREDPGAISSFLAAGSALDDALGRALGGDRDQVRQAQSDERAALAEVVGRAGDVLEAAGRRLADQDRQRLTGTLRAAVTDHEVRKRLTGGMLVDDVEAPAFGFGFGAATDGGADVVSLAAARAKRATPTRTGARTGTAAGAKGGGGPRRRTGAAADDGASRAAAERQAAEDARAEAQRREAERLAAERARLQAERGVRERELEARRAEAVLAEDALRAARAAADAANAAVDDAQIAVDETTAAIDSLAPG